MLLPALLLPFATGADGVANAASPVPHTFALVNDPRSHGIVGDSLLSLNEAIQLHNRTLTVNQLSAAELGQLSGFGLDISWVNIDATSVPQITVDRDFDAILNFPHGLLIQGYNGNVVIDFGNSNVQGGFRSTSDYCSWRNVVLRNGAFGIDLQQADASFGGTVLDNVAFENFSQFGFRVTGLSQGQVGRVLMQHCRFSGMPAGIVCDDNPSGRTSILAAFDTEMQGVGNGIDVLVGPGGQMSMQFDRVDLTVTSTGIRIHRVQGTSRALTLGATHLRIRAGSCLEIQGCAAADSDVQLRMLDLTAATPNAPAITISPVGGRVVGVLEDSRMAGDVTFLTGAAVGSLAFANNRVRGGTVAVGSSAAQPVVVEGSRFDACNISTTGLVAVPCSACCFVGGSLQGIAPAPMTIVGSHISASIGAAVSVIAPLPAPQLGSFDVTPTRPFLGGPLSFQADLPGGLFGLFVMGATVDPPTLLAAPLHLYLAFPGFTFPGTYRLQQGFTITIPNSPSLAGSDWVCQMAVLPDAGMQAPPLQAPPGVRFLIR